MRRIRDSINRNIYYIKWLLIIMLAKVAIRLYFNDRSKTFTRNLHTFNPHLRGKRSVSIVFICMNTIHFNAYSIYNCWYPFYRFLLQTEHTCTALMLYLVIIYSYFFSDFGFNRYLLFHILIPKRELFVL